MDDLTNEQKLLLTAMYRDYLELSKKVGPEKANRFGDSDEILYLIFNYPHKHYTFKHFEV